MTKSKFTPGPYRVSNSFEGGDRELWIYSDMTYLGSVANSSMTPGEIAANAELWVDAPRLLEVLRGIRDAENNVDLYITMKLADALLEKHGG
jgi:hypothetical protein